MEDAAHSIFSTGLSLLAGYLFIHVSYYRRYAAVSVKAERLALYLLGWSFAAYLLGELLSIFLRADPLTPQFLVPARNDLYRAGITPAILNAIFLGVLLGELDNIWTLFQMRNEMAAFPRETSYRLNLKLAASTLFVRRSSDPALRMIFRATTLQKYLMITLKSHKVYVGKPYSSPGEDPSREITYIKILPVYSGHRDPTTKKVTLGTSYNDLKKRLARIESDPQELADLETEEAQRAQQERDADPLNPLAQQIWALVENGEEQAEIDLNDIGVVIAWSHVETMTIFDEDLYEAFQTPLTGAVAKSPDKSLADFSGSL